MERRRHGLPPMGSGTSCRIACPHGGRRGRHASSLVRGSTRRRPLLGRDVLRQRPRVQPRHWPDLDPAQLWTGLVPVLRQFCRARHVHVPHHQRGGTPCPQPRTPPRGSAIGRRHLAHLVGAGPPHSHPPQRHRGGTLCGPRLHPQRRVRRHSRPPDQQSRRHQRHAKQVCRPRLCH